MGQKEREKRLLIGCRGWLEEEASDDAKDKVNEKWPRPRQRDGEGRKKIGAWKSSHVAPSSVMALLLWVSRGPQFREGVLRILSWRLPEPIEGERRFRRQSRQQHDQEEKHKEIDHPDPDLVEETHRGHYTPPAATTCVRNYKRRITGICVENPLPPEAERTLSLGHGGRNLPPPQTIETRLKSTKVVGDWWHGTKRWSVTV